MMSVLKRVVPKRWRQSLRERFGEHIYARRSYSQEGEDLILQRLFGGKMAGIYVDVGAHHPFRFSNTFLLHKRGWRGINIDAQPGSMELFSRFRPHDINLEIGVSTTSAELDFFVFEEPALNTFDAELAGERQGLGWRMIKTIKVPCMTLADILARELPRFGPNDVDLLTVDVEGFDIEVLQSNDWAKVRPRAIVVEILDQDLAGVLSSDVGGYVTSLGYRPFAKLHHSVVFLRTDGAED